jgi:hypothetical protein
VDEPLRMRMKDSFPLQFAIKIDRPRLRNYLRAKWLLSWTAALCLVGGGVGMASVSKELERREATSREIASTLASAGAVGALCGVGAGMGLYFLLSHWLASRIAESLEVSVEGAFLRIRQRTIVTTDRKLHFCSIVDYVTVQGGLMHLFGIEMLQMTVIGGGPGGMVAIPGVKECLKMRDVLSEVDRLRENS